MSRRLSDWASVAEIVSALAIVVSLLYVAYQIKENTIEVRATNRQELIARAMTAVERLADPQLSGLATKVAQGEALTPVERTQYTYIARTVLYDVQEAYLLYREGRLDEAYWNTRQSLILSYLQPTTAREIYRENASIGVLHADFVQWLDSALEERYED